MIGKTISHYKIISKIGEGGRGVVYRAEDVDLKRTVALKFISPHLADNAEDLDSLYQEARSASQLNHPNITTIYEIAHSGKFNFIAMECIDGETLKNKIEREVLSFKDIMHIAIATLNGIRAAHDNNIIHRDIKTENIMITETGTVKVMDFGLAKNLDRENVTKISRTLGTIAYMSPEQIEGSRVDQRSDIYSFGIVLYEMVTGRLPFVGEHEAATLYSIVNELPPDIATLNPDANPNLIAIIEKAIEKTPDNRYQKVTELLDDLNELKGGTYKRRIKKPSWLSAIPKKVNRVWFAGGFITILLIVFATLMLFVKGEKESARIISSLAVLNFDNIQEPSDPNRLGQILQELIIADLSEIPNLKVFSSQRLFDIQKQLGSDNRNSIDPGLATDIAQEVGAKTMLTGNVLQTGNNLILISQLINTSDGSIIKSHQVEGNDIYSMVDELTAQIQLDMQLSVGSDEPIDVAVVDRTTSSMNAFQHYFNGIDHFNDSHFKEAIVELNNAIDLDSTFSSAYYKLALAQWWSQSEMDNETIKNAQESLSKILNGSWYRTTKEKLLARGAFELTKRNYSEAENIYQQLIDFLSDEKEAWYGLGEAYFHGSQDMDNASNAFERAVELDPEFTIAYRHIFDIYGLRNEYDSGIIRATQLIEKNPDNVWGHIFLGQMFIGKEDYIQAKKTFEKAVQIDPDLSIIYHYLTRVFIELKQFNEGIAFANTLIESNNSRPQLFHLIAQMYIGTNKIGQAIQTYKTVLNDAPNSYQNLLNLAHAYQFSGDYDQAMSQYSNVERIFPEIWESQKQYLLSSIYFEQGRYKDVIDLIVKRLSDLKESDLNTQSDLLIDWAFLSYLLGDSNIANTKLDQVLSNSISLKNQLVAYLVKGYVLAESNRISDLSNIIKVAQDLVDEHKDESLYSILNSAIRFNYYFAKKDYTHAISEFDNMDDLGDFKYRYYYYAGLAYLELEQYPNVLELIKEMRKPFISPDVRSFIYPRSFYIEGLMNEAIGNTVLAKQNYHTLLNIWIDGDKEAPNYQSVIQRYNSL
ncbi:MAG: protein kinase [Candidatus Marinimicrobia bacterium]|nr:protein kinase [Candidatus Neomarinimicrobiota bacterium]